MAKLERSTRSIDDETKGRSQALGIETPPESIDKIIQEIKDELKEVRRKLKTSPKGFAVKLAWKRLHREKLIAESLRGKYKLFLIPITRRDWREFVVNQDLADQPKLRERLIILDDQIIDKLGNW